MAEPWRNLTRRSVTRLRDGLRSNGENRPHYVVCGQDPLAIQLVHELLKESVRVTVIVPSRRRPDGPDIRSIRGIRLLRADRLDEDTFRAAGLRGARGLALMHQDDVQNIHAALCAQEVAPDVPLVMRVFNLSLGRRVKQLFTDCEVVSDAAMAAPAFVAAALGEVAPTYFHHLGRTLFVARRRDVRPENVVCGLADMSDPDHPKVLPAEPADMDASSADLVLAGQATGKPTGKDLAARRIVRSRRRRARRRPIMMLLRALRSFATRKIGMATLAVLGVVAISGALLARAMQVDVWQALYITLLTTFSGAEPDDAALPAQVQVMQVVLTLAGLALIPLITAAVVDGIVNARLALDAGRLRAPREGHIVVIGLGNVGTGVIRQLRDLDIEVVAIDKDPAARGAGLAEQLDIPFIVGDGAREENLRLASVATAQALIIVSTDDVTNLEAALNARELKPNLPVVLRLYDGDLAQRIQRVFGIGVTRSVSYLAAPTFAAAMLDRDVIATIPVERHALLVAEVTIFANSSLVDRPLSAATQPHLVRVIAHTPAGQSRPLWSPSPNLQVAVGDRLTVVAGEDGLGWLLRQAHPAVASEQPEDSDTIIPAPRKNEDIPRTTGDAG
ncbi:MAG TPA: NAD-binding protein [Micromonospora sp.]|nr:NAD-binding protein [Micromonospora sp.]